MARNHEKHYGKLNRLILQKEAEKWEEKHPKRPRLEHLHDVNEIKNWLPSIKRDIDFCLKQSQVTCYPERKISELQNNVMKLEKEYKSFVRKLKQLDSNCIDIPWTNRPYKRKINNSDTVTSKLNHSDVTKISTPILDNERKIEDIPEINEHCCENTQDKPLNFLQMQNGEIDYKYSPSTLIVDNVSDADIVNNHLDWSAVQKTTTKIMRTFQLEIPVSYPQDSTASSIVSDIATTDQDVILTDRTSDNKFRQEGSLTEDTQTTRSPLTTSRNSFCKNILGLDYSSSEESSN